MAISKFLRWAWEKKGVEGRGLVTLPSLLTLKKRTRTFNFWWNEPSLKFIWVCLSKEPYMPPWHNLQRLPLDPGGGSGGVLCVHWSLCYMIFELFLTKWLSQNFIGCILEKRTLQWGGGVVAHQSLLTLKKGTRSFDFHLIPFNVYATTPSIWSAFWKNKWTSPSGVVKPLL